MTRPAARLAARLKQAVQAARFVGEGATGFDGFDEGRAACLGSKFLVKPLGKFQLPTLNWRWLHKLSSTRLSNHQ